MIPRIPLRQRLRYRFDNTLSSGTIALVLWLGALTLLLVVVAGFILALFRVATGTGEQASMVEGVWVSLLRTLDPGTMGADQGWTFRLVSLGVTMGGIFIVSALIGIITTGIERALEDLRRGKSLVAESGHTLILGWTPSVVGIVEELAIANESERSSAVVILADADKVEMEAALRHVRKAARKGRGGMRVICRTGRPSRTDDLDNVRPEAAKSIIVVGGSTRAADAEVLKTVLALEARENDQNVPVVAEFFQRSNARAL